MAKLSEQLADLSVHAKHAEDAIAAAQKEAQDKLMERRDQARNAAAAAIQNVDQTIKNAGDNLKSAGDVVTAKLKSIQSKLHDDMESMKSQVAQKKHDFDASRAESRADWLEWEAQLAVEYAIAAIDQAELAVLDAVAGRKQATEARRT